jgi:hypothetical protein
MTAVAWSPRDASGRVRGPAMSTDKIAEAPDQDRELIGRAAYAVQRAMWWLCARQGDVDPMPRERELDEIIVMEAHRSSALDADSFSEEDVLPMGVLNKPNTDRLGLIHFGDGVSIPLTQVWRVTPDGADPVLWDVKHEWREREDENGRAQRYQETVFVAPARVQVPTWQTLLVSFILRAKAAMIAWERDGRQERAPDWLGWPAPLTPAMMNTLGDRAHPTHVLEDARMACSAQGLTLPAWVTEREIRLALARASFQSGGARQISTVEILKMFRSPDAFGKRVWGLAESVVRWAGRDDSETPAEHVEASVARLLEHADVVRGLQRSDRDRFKARIEEVKARAPRTDHDRIMLGVLRRLQDSRLPRRPDKLTPWVGDTEATKVTDERLTPRARFWLNFWSERENISGAISGTCAEKTELFPAVEVCAPPGDGGLVSRRRQ